MAIDINRIVSVTTDTFSGVIAQPSLITNFLCENVLVPAGDANNVLSFNTLSSVGDYFGTNSDEYQVATNYFLGYNGSQKKPSKILFSRFVQAPERAYLFSQKIIDIAGTISAVIIQGIPTLELHGNGNNYPIPLKQSDFVNVKSLADITAEITLKINAIVGLENSYLTVISDNRIILKMDHSISFCTGNIAEILGIDQKHNPTLSQETSGGDVSFNMKNILSQNRDWIAISYVYRLQNDTIDNQYTISIQLAKWLQTQSGTNNYIGLFWEGGLQPLNINSNISLVARLVDAGLAIKNDGQIVIQVPAQIDYNGNSLALSQDGIREIGRYSAFVGGMGASIDYSIANAKINFAHKKQTGLKVNVTNDADYDNLLANGYNVYGRFASRTSLYDATENGSFGGPFRYIDNIYDAVWLQSIMTDNLATLLTSEKRIPYGDRGKSLIDAIINDVANTGKISGVIETGNTFTELEIQKLIELVGKDVSSLLSKNGYYVYYPPNDPTKRILRAKYQVQFIYTNNGAINQIGVDNVFMQ